MLSSFVTQRLSATRNLRTGFPRKAATVSVKRDQADHAPEVRTVIQITAIPSAHYKARLNQAFQVKRKRRGRQIQTLGQLGGGVPLRTPLYEHAVHAKTGFRCEGAQGFDGVN
jgi:hypothetical protein